MSLVMSDISRSSLGDDDRSDAVMTHVTDSMKGVDLASTIPGEGIEGYKETPAEGARKLGKDEYVECIVRLATEREPMGELAGGLLELDAKVDRRLDGIEDTMNGMKRKMNSLEILMRQIHEEIKVGLLIGFFLFLIKN